MKWANWMRILSLIRSGTLHSPLVGAPLEHRKLTGYGIHIQCPNCARLGIKGRVEVRGV